MKTRLFITYWVGILLLTGCSDFLEEDSQGQVRPESVSDMEKILIGDGYFNAADGWVFNKGTDFLTDNYKCADEKKQNTSLKEVWRWFFTWDPLMFNKAGGGENIQFWYAPYKRIKGCNVVLDYLDAMEGDHKKREYLRGEARALRGFYYLQLVNFFGMPFNSGDADKNLAVPLKLTSRVQDKGLGRNTVGEIYAQIETDLITGLASMEESGFTTRDEERLRPRSVRALLSRMYLYEERWDKVVQYANESLEEQSELLHLAEVDSATMVYDTLEVLWKAPVQTVAESNMYMMPFIVSDEMVNLYQEGAGEDSVYDIRGDYQGDRINAYIELGKNNEEGEADPWAAHFRKCAIFEVGGGIRVAEVYLNRAEACIRQYAEKGDVAMGQLGLEDLNTLRRARFHGKYVDKTMEDFGDAQALLDFCLRERRRELCGECNHRWFDLRRLGMPRIEHEFFNRGEKDNAQVFVLEEEDPRYVLPVPEKILENNTDL